MEDALRKEQVNIIAQSFASTLGAIKIFLNILKAFSSNLITQHFSNIEVY